LSYGALALIFQKDFEAALQWADRAMSIPNCQYWASAHKVVACAYLGKQDELDNAKALLLRQSPNFSLAFAREKLFYLRKQTQVELYITGLEKAGLPD
jgi:hypothetical protein